MFSVEITSLMSSIHLYHMTRLTLANFILKPDTLVSHLISMPIKTSSEQVEILCIINISHGNVNPMFTQWELCKRTLFKVNNKDRNDTNKSGYNAFLEIDETQVYNFFILWTICWLLTAIKAFKMNSLIGYTKVWILSSASKIVLGEGNLHPLTAVFFDLPPIMLLGFTESQEKWVGG